MAGQMAHMEIAYELAGRLHIDEGREEFIMGSVAPDAVHYTEPYRTEKIHTHLCENVGAWGHAENYDVWLGNIREFWNKYVITETDVKKKAFLMGICVHCLTDYWNDLMVWKVCQRKMMPPMNFDEFKEAYYPEAQRLDRWLYQVSGWSEKIMKLFNNAKVMGFKDYVNETELYELKDYLINTQYNLQGIVDVSDHKYYKSEHLLYFIAEATDKIHEQLQELMIA